MFKDLFLNSQDLLGLSLRSVTSHSEYTNHPISFLRPQKLREILENIFNEDASINERSYVF